MLWLPLGLAVLLCLGSTGGKVESQCERPEQVAASVSLFGICCGWMCTFVPFSHHSCTMRIGRGIHPEGMPGWCQGFSLDGGSGVRALKVIQQGNRPGLIYNIGGSCLGLRAGGLGPLAKDLRPA